MRQLSNNVYIATQYSGVNVGAILTSTGIICVDVPSYPLDVQDWLMRLRRLSPYPIRYTILTNAHGDRVLNAHWPQAPIVAHQGTADLHADYEKRYPPTHIESLRQRNMLYARDLKNSPVAFPTLTFSDKSIILADDDYEIHLYAAPGPMKGNCFIHLPKDDVMFVGDVLVEGSHPLLGYDGEIQEWIETLKEKRPLLDSVGTLVPGRGEFVKPESADAIVAFLEKTYDIVDQHLEADLPFDTIGKYVSDLYRDFPSSGVPAEWLLDQLQTMLELTYRQRRPESPTPIF